MKQAIEDDSASSTTSPVDLGPWIVVISAVDARRPTG